MATGKEADLFEIIHQLSGVDYLYENDTLEDQEDIKEDAPFSQEAMAALPVSFVCECRQAAENADIFRLLELIAAVSNINVKIGRRLNELAQRYAYEEIVSLLTVRG